MDLRTMFLRNLLRLSTRGVSTEAKQAKEKADRAVSSAIKALDEYSRKNKERLQKFRDGQLPPIQIGSNGIRR